MGLAKSLRLKELADRREQELWGATPEAAAAYADYIIAGWGGEKIGEPYYDAARGHWYQLRKVPRPSQGEKFGKYIDEKFAQRLTSPPTDRRP